jgi:hypothetical protein
MDIYRILGHSAFRKPHLAWLEGHGHITSRSKSIFGNDYLDLPVIRGSLINAMDEYDRIRILFDGA